MAFDTTHEDYPRDIQHLFLRTMVSDPDAYARTQSIIKPDYFDDSLRPAAKFILDYAQTYNKLPSPDQVLAQTRVNVPRFEDAVEHTDWYMQTIEKFCRYRALEIAVLNGVDMIQKGEGAKLEEMVKEAMTISIDTDLGTGYFDDPRTRLNRLKDNSAFIPTGWDELDSKLYGGFTPGSLNIFAGGSGSGKSLFLQNIALNWALRGMDVVYITLELSEDLVNLRLDSMLTGLGTKNVLRNVDDASLMIALQGKKAGRLLVKKMPEGGTTCNKLRAYLKEYEIKFGKKPDAIVIDYLDLIYPNNGKIDVTNAFAKDKYVSEEMRGIATDWGVPLVTASQLNRQSVDAQEFDHSHIAGGISKINTADNVFGIFTSNAMKERGEYRLQFLKTRSSSAVGQTISLGYNNNSMRIINALNDAGQKFEDEIEAKTTANSLDDLRKELRNKTAEAPVMEGVASGGMSISQMAHPQHLSREQIMAKNGVRAPAPTTTTVTAGPKVDDLMSRINSIRKSSE